MKTVMGTARVARVIELYVEGNVTQAHKLIEDCSVEELCYLCDKIDRALEYARGWK